MLLLPLAAAAQNAANAAPEAALRACFAELQPAALLAGIHARDLAAPHPAEA
ncbi:MAG: hypothetical protein U1F21_03445 [Sphaerotilus natans]